MKTIILDNIYIEHLEAKINQTIARLENNNCIIKNIQLTNTQSNTYTVLILWEQIHDI